MHVSMLRSIQVWGFRFSYSYSYFRTRTVSYRTSLSVLVSYRIILGYITYLVRSLHVLEYVIIRTRIVSYRTRVRHLPRSFSARTRVRHYPYLYRIISYRIVHHYPYSYRIVSYSGTSPTSFVLCTYSSTSLSVLVSYRIVLGYVTYLVCSLHVLEYVIIRTRIVSYRTRISVLGYVTYLVRSLHVLEYVIIRTRLGCKTNGYSIRCL